MKISIVTVCLNVESVIRDCLNSVAEQTHDHIEHVIIDGVSTDGTLAIVREFPHIALLISEADSGLYDAMNKGLAHITGDYVLFLNADDRLPSRNTLATAVAAIERDPGADVYYGWLEVRNSEGSAFVFRPPPPEEAAEFMVTNCLPHQATLAKPSVFTKTGPFDLRYRYHADYDWFLKIIADQSIKITALPCSIGSFLEGGASSQLEKGQPEVFLIQNGAALYSKPEWDRRRIGLIQDAWLRERIAATLLRKNSRTASRHNSLTDRAGFLGRAQGGSPRAALYAVARTTRHTLLTLRWRSLDFIVRALPPSIVDGLRRLRARWRRIGL